MIIDIHTHILPHEIITQRQHLCEADSWFGQLYANPKARLATGNDLVTSMDTADVDASVAFGFSFTDPGLIETCNDYVLDQADRQPGRIIPFAIANPAAPGGIAEARRAIVSGAKGIGELVPDAFGLTLDDPAWDPLCQIAREADVPILLHVAEQVGHVYPGKGTQGAEQAYRLIARHPNTRFILAHWGGGLPFYELMPEVQAALANTWYDTAASLYLYRDEIFDLVSRWAPTKALFGSDYPLIGQKRFLRRVRDAVPDDEQRANLLGNNAVRALGLESDA